MLWLEYIHKDVCRTPWIADGREVLGKEGVQETTMGTFPTSPLKMNFSNLSQSRIAIFWMYWYHIPMNRQEVPDKRHTSAFLTKLGCWPGVTLRRTLDYLDLISRLQKYFRFKMRLHKIKRDYKQGFDFIYLSTQPTPMNPTQQPLNIYPIIFKLPQGNPLSKGCTNCHKC